MGSQASEGRIWVYNLGQLLGDEPTLLHVEIKERSLATYASSRPTGRGHASATKLNLAHDYVIITALGKDGTKVAFVVEKLDKTQRVLHGKTDAGLRSDDRAGTLYVNIEVGFGDPGNSKSRHRETLESTKIPIADLIAILTADGEGYNVANSKCHQYAFGITTKLVSLGPTQASPSFLDNGERDYCCGCVLA